MLAGCTSAAINDEHTEMSQGVLSSTPFPEGPQLSLSHLPAAEPKAVYQTQSCFRRSQFILDQIHAFSLIQASTFLIQADTTTTTTIIISFEAFPPCLRLRPK